MQLSWTRQCRLINMQENSIREIIVRQSYTLQIRLHWIQFRRHRCGDYNCPELGWKQRQLKSMQIQLRFWQQKLFPILSNTTYTHGKDFKWRAKNISSTLKLTFMTQTETQLSEIFGPSIFALIMNEFVRCWPWPTGCMPA